VNVSNRRGVIVALVVASLFASACGARDQARSIVGGSSPSAAQLEDMEVRAWSPLPDASLSARHDAHGFWVDDTFLVMGGRDTPACPPGAGCVPPTRPALRDGARYWPDERRWTPTTEAPVPLDDASTTSADGVAYWWLPDPQGDKDVSVVAYDVDEDRWEVLPSPPAPASRDWLQLVGVDGKVIAYWMTHETGPRSPDLIYDPATASWRELPMDPLGPSFDRSMVWTGRELILLALDLVPNPNSEEPSLYRAAALDLASDSWRRFPDSEILGGWPTWFPTTGAVVNPALGIADGGETNNWGRHYPNGGMLDPEAAEWSPLPAAPSESGGFTGPAAADDRVILNGQGWLLDVRAGTWTNVPAPPDQGPAEFAEGHTVAVGDGVLYTWGGVTWDSDSAPPADGVLSARGWAFPAHDGG
jgi:hypothetical protein